MMPGPVTPVAAKVETGGADPVVAGAEALPVVTRNVEPVLSGTVVADAVVKEDVEPVVSTVDVVMFVVVVLLVPLLFA